MASRDHLPVDPGRSGMEQRKQDHPVGYAPLANKGSQSAIELERSHTTRIGPGSARWTQPHGGAEGRTRSPNR